MVSDLYQTSTTSSTNDQTDTRLNDRMKPRTTLCLTTLFTHSRIDESALTPLQRPSLLSLLPSHTHKLTRSVSPLASLSTTHDTRPQAVVATLDKPEELKWINSIIVRIQIHQ